MALASDRGAELWLGSLPIFHEILAKALSSLPLQKKIDLDQEAYKMPSICNIQLHFSGLWKGQEPGHQRDGEKNLDKKLALPCFSPTAAVY